VHHWDRETKSKLKQWVHNPQKFTNATLCRKINGNHFLGRQGHPIEYMPKGTTINANVYANTLKELREAIDQKRPDFFQSRSVSAA
jgi:hypothetical protein